MATRANLIATYQGNPTLQNQYTLQQYLDLFDFGQTPTTPTPTPIPTPTPAPTPGIPNIINQNLNPDGDGGQIPINPTTNPSRFATYEREYDPSLNFAEFTSGTEGIPSFTQQYNKPPSFIESILSLPGQLTDAYANISPVLSYLKNKQVEKEKRTQATIQKAKAERELKEKIAREKAAAEALALENAKRIGRRPSAPTGGGQRDSGGDFGGYSYDGGGREGFGYGLADGGRVDEDEGGIKNIINSLLRSANPSKNTIMERLRRRNVPKSQLKPMATDYSTRAKDLAKPYIDMAIGAGYGNVPGKKQGIGSDVRHTAGASMGKDAFIDYVSQPAFLNINPEGRIANLIGNAGILGATILEEGKDAYKSLKAGEGLTQPFEDVSANLKAMSLPYGSTTEEKLKYAIDQSPSKSMIPQTSTPEYDYVAAQKGTSTPTPTFSNKTEIVGEINGQPIYDYVDRKQRDAYELSLQNKSSNAISPTDGGGPGANMTFDPFAEERARLIKAGIDPMSVGKQGGTGDPRNIAKYGRPDMLADGGRVYLYNRLK